MEPRILKGPESKHPRIKKSVGELFFEQAEKLADKVFQIDADTGKKETWEEAKVRAIRVALHLKTLFNFKENDKVLVCCENTIDNVIPVLAAFFIGGIVSSIDPKETTDEIEHSLQLVRPNFIFAEQKSVTQIQKSLDGFGEGLNYTMFVIGSDKENAAGCYLMEDLNVHIDGDDTFQPVRKNINDTAILVFSSGTTSLPKAIAISHYGVLHGFLCLVQEMDNCRPQVILHFASLYWISAILLTGIIIATGSTKVVAPKITAIDLLEIVEKYKITFIFMSNTYSYGITDLPERILKKYDTSSLYSIIIGGSTVNPFQLKKMRKLLPHTKTTVGYGSSEAAAVAAFDLKDVNAYEEKILSSGKIASDVQVKIVDMDTRELLPPNKTGEILVKSPYLMKGYYNTMKTKSPYDEDGFLKTGDLGYYDEEEYLYVTDRVNDSFKYQTYQVSPLEIERVLLEHPAVNDVVVFPVFHDVDRNHPGAAVVLKNNTNANEEELLNFVNQRVSDKNKLRAGLEIVNRIPKTITGKVLRTVARNNFLERRNLKLHGKNGCKT